MDQKNETRTWTKPTLTELDIADLTMVASHTSGSPDALNVLES